MVKMRNFNPSVAFVFVVVMTGVKSAQSTRVLKHRQNAVFSLVGSENFYVEIKKKIPVTYVDDGQSGHLRDYDYSNDNSIDYEQYKNLKPPSTQQIPTEIGQSEDVSDKSMICSFIIDSHFFEARGEVAVNYDLTQTEIINELRESKRDTFNDIYGDYPNAHGRWLNPYKQRTVLVGGERFEEQTFRCLARRRDSTTSAADSYAYVDYFVSPIYLSKRPKDLVMNGRFVFTSNEDNELIPIATAEERVGKVIDSRIDDIIQRYYDSKNAKPDVASNELCTLTVRDKIRLCDSVINLPDFPGEVSFVPNEANVQEKCVAIRVSGTVGDYKIRRSFRTGRFKFKKSNREVTFDQWMVGCKVAETKSNPLFSHAWYYISPGMYSDAVEVFVGSATKYGSSSHQVCVTEIFWAERVHDGVSTSSKVVNKN